MEKEAKNRLKTEEYKKRRLSMRQTSLLRSQRETLEAVEAGPSP